MQRFTVFLMLTASLIIGMASVAHGAEPIKGYIYDGVGRAKNLSIVINAMTDDVEIQGTTRARIDTSSNVITNAYRDCGNDTYYCLTGLLEIVIPKAMPIRAWTYHGLSCQSFAEAVRDNYRITCQSSKYRGRPAYTYSLSHGVVSIDSSPVAGNYKYVLRGRVGLFSPGN